MVLVRVDLTSIRIFPNTVDENTLAAKWVHRWFKKISRGMCKPLGTEWRHLSAPICRGPARLLWTCTLVMLQKNFWYFPTLWRCLNGLAFMFSKDILNAYLISSQVCLSARRFGYYEHARKGYQSSVWKDTISGCWIFIEHLQGNLNGTSKHFGWYCSGTCCSKFLAELQDRLHLTFLLLGLDIISCCSNTKQEVLDVAQTSYAWMGLRTDWFNVISQWLLRDDMCTDVQKQG